MPGGAVSKVRLLWQSSAAADESYRSRTFSSMSRYRPLLSLKQCDQIGWNFAVWLLFAWAIFTFSAKQAASKHGLLHLFWQSKGLECRCFGLSIWAGILWLQFGLHFQILAKFLFNFLVTLNKDNIIGLSYIVSLPDGWKVVALIQNFDCQKFLE